MEVLVALSEGAIGLSSDHYMEVIEATISGLTRATLSASGQVTEKKVATLNMIC